MTTAAFGKQFVVGDDIAWEPVGEGVKRKIMSYDANLMMVLVAFEQGGIGAAHSHPHTQMSYVESGAFEITIGDEKQILKGGDVYYIPPHIRHGAVCQEAGILVDVFTPMREDFISTEKG